MGRKAFVQKFVRQILLDFSVAGQFAGIFIGFVPLVQAAYSMSRHGQEFEYVVAQKPVTDSAEVEVKALQDQKSIASPSKRTPPHAYGNHANDEKAHRRPDPSMHLSNVSSKAANNSIACKMEMGYADCSATAAGGGSGARRAVPPPRSRANSELNLLNVDPDDLEPIMKGRASGQVFTVFGTDAD